MKLDNFMRRVLINQFENVAKEVEEKLGEYLTNLGEGINLKLYDIAYHYDNKFNLSEKEYDIFFQEFCTVSYDDFINSYSKDINEIEFDYIGRRTTFYITSTDLLQYTRNFVGLDTRQKVIELIKSYLDNYYYCNLDIEYTTDERLVWIDIEEFNFSFNDFDIHRLFEEMAEEIVNYYEEDLKNINNAYEEIKEFKKNQINLFNKFVENNL